MCARLSKCIERREAARDAESPAAEPKWWIEPAELVSDWPLSRPARYACSATAMGPAISRHSRSPKSSRCYSTRMGSCGSTDWVPAAHPSELSLSPLDAERIIRLVASHVGVEVHAGAPVLSAELPETGERFEGMLPPIAEFPIFAIRKRAAGVIPLEIYVRTGVISAEQYRCCARRFATASTSS